MATSNAFTVADLESYADQTGPVSLDWPVAVAFSASELARPRR
jgi:hypothetical protein